ncbi:MAG TPA: outer membrane beta-barrel protein [Verrucomicrobiae bacterium]|nr:outer membrane beta-barrel protein [Verrucomicrobiae bacterium]
MNRRVLPLLVSALLLAGSSLSTADAVRKWTIDVGVQGSEIKFDKTLDVNNDLANGFRLGLVIHPALQIEGTYDTVSTRRSEAKLADSTYKQEFTGLRVMGVLKGSDDVKVNPYMIIGGGKAKTTFDPGNPGSTIRSDNTLYGDVGFGVRYQAWKGLHVNGEFVIRHLRTLDTSGTDALFSVGASWMIGFGKK